MSDLTFIIDDESVREPNDQVDLNTGYTRLAKVLSSAHDAGLLVVVPELLWVAECFGGVNFSQRLTGTALNRDVRILILRLLNRASTTTVPKEVVAIRELVLDSQALSAVLHEPLIENTIALVTLWPYTERGLTPVTNEEVDREVYCVMDTNDQIDFYRYSFEAANIQEQEFLSLAKLAFPNLCFAKSLSFRKFEGSYAGLRDAVVHHLSAINDRFTEAFRQPGSNSDTVSAIVGVDMSIEGSARSSRKAMAERDVYYEGIKYRCEWHSKIEPHRNRIHVHPGDSSTGEKVLIGIFVDHL
ncbi:hypothetical protein ACNQVK_16860 [Mycobacterium sp. 134]|uniref:hypothetical protein n=1 Tax=Mycobacterium sp. 134 TaxID=3400425 RepID=UPI003AAB7CE0